MSLPLAVLVPFGPALGGRFSLKRFAKNLNHRFLRNAVLGLIVARGPTLAVSQVKGGTL
ncbi:hypothetical protein [uncultured Roseovarius sp.]|uniref:hypothetical protein n=1 Tax=uncultured Roseovarius sp. TaxID=293344 RepID=UPI0025E0BCF5|nr:hypothetical protein [uncultured Roseovarius sp.]